MENYTESGSCLFSFCQNPSSAPFFFFFFFVLTQHTEQWITPSPFSGVPPTSAGGEKKGKIKPNYQKKTKLCKMTAQFTEPDLGFDTVCTHLPEQRAFPPEGASGAGSLPPRGGTRGEAEEMRLLAAFSYHHPSLF